MKIFLDTADTEVISRHFNTGLIDGVTTNPTLIMKSGKDPEEVYQEIVKIVEETNEDFVSVEKRMLDFTHVDTGYFLLEKWKFTQVLKDVVLYHHDLEIFMGTDRIIGVVCFADHLSHVFLERRYDTLDQFLEYFDLKENELDQLVEESTKEIESLYSIL